MKEYEPVILTMREAGCTRREIADEIGVELKQIEWWVSRYNKRQALMLKGHEPKPKGRPRKDGTGLPPSVQQLSRLTQLQYELAMKERHIKRLEMENELMRDFLSLTERK